MVLPFKDEPRIFESDYALSLRKDLEARLVAQRNVVLCANEEDLSTIVRVQDLFLTGLYERSSEDQPISQLVNAEYAAEGRLERTTSTAKVHVALWDLKAGVVLSALEYPVALADATEVPSSFVRRFPQPYLVNQVDSLGKGLAAALSQTSAYGSYKVFPLVVDRNSVKTSRVEQFLLDRFTDALKASNPVQTNYAGSRVSYSSLDVLLKELKTPIYAKSKYLLLELEFLSRGDYFDVQLRLLDSAMMSELFKGDLQFENSPSVKVYNAE